MDRAYASEAVFAFLEETAPIFDLVKKYSILVEELLPAKKAPIHAANELKSLVFHLYKAKGTIEETNTNILEAKEHLCRAFYDLHCMVVSVYINQIVEKVKNFKLTTVTKVCPAYHQTIRPQMIDIQDNLREIRTHRNTDIEYLENNLCKFEEHTKVLGKIDDIIESYFPDFAQYEDERKREKRGERAWDVAKIVIQVLFGLIVGIFIGRATVPAKQKPETAKQEQQKVDSAGKE